MIGALWTGISGLAGQQTALDNESNNIANVNTVGYKSSRISFADQMYQDKIGKGTTILDAEKLYKQGNLKLTGVSYDMALSGDGFFAVSNSRGSGTAETFYTRAGNFRMGDNGKLQDSAGNEVQGWAMSSLDPDSDVTTTNDNIKKFTDDYVKLAASQIVKKSTSIETISAKMTDYTSSAKADDVIVMTGAGYKTKSTKISDVELLISSYSSKLTSYASNPDATSTPSVAQNSYLDYDLDNATVDEGDQIYVYINGTKYAQSYETSELVTMQKLTDQLSNIPGIDAYIGASTSATAPSPTDTNGYVIINSLIPGNAVTIGDVAIVHDGATTLKASGTNTASVEGTGYGAVLSAMTYLKEAVAGEQRDIWGDSDIGTLDTDDKIKYSLTVGTNIYTVEIQEDETTITTDSSDTSTATVTAVTDGNKIDQLVTAINSHSKMDDYIVARNINGNLVVESIASGEEFTGSLTLDYQPEILGTELHTITITAANDTDYQLVVDGETITYHSDGTATKGEIADGLKAALEANETLNAKYTATNSGDDLLIEDQINGIGGFVIDDSDANLSEAVTTASTLGHLESAGDADTDILSTGETFKFDMSEVVNDGEEIELNFTSDTDDSGAANAGDIAYKLIMTGGSKSVTITTTPNGGSSTTSTVTLSYAVTTANAAEMLAEAIEAVAGLEDNVAASKDANTSTQLNLAFEAHKGIDISLKYGNNSAESVKNNNSDYSVNAGTGAEFMQIKTTIDQTASKGGLQLRLDVLGISNSAFGDFSVDNTGLITMKQDGAEFAIGQVAIALFNDNRGLEPRGDNLLGITSQSGDPIYNINNNKTAEVKAKTLELSTADLSESLVNLMVFQRAFEANAKSITTADAILNTLIQLKR